MNPNPVFVLLIQFEQGVKKGLASPSYSYSEALSASLPKLVLE